MKTIIASIVVVLIFWAVLTCCNNRAVARRFLETQGYTDIEITWFPRFSRIKDGVYHALFVATCPNGVCEEGTVCVSNPNSGATHKVLESHGYTDIAITGYQWFSSSKYDTNIAGFTATSPADVRIAGSVYVCFLFKNVVELC